jgi:hypothetical protein
LAVSLEMRSSIRTCSAVFGGNDALAENAWGANNPAHAREMTIRPMLLSFINILDDRGELSSYEPDGSATR